MAEAMVKCHYVKGAQYTGILYKVQVADGTPNVPSVSAGLLLESDAITGIEACEVHTPETDQVVMEVDWMGMF